MAFVVADRVQESVSVTGTGAASLTGASPGYRAFSSVTASGDIIEYALVDSVANTWEVGVGTVTGSTLARTTVLASSNANALVSFAGNTGMLAFLTVPASRILSFAPLANPSFSGTVVAPTLQSTTITAGAAARIVDASLPIQITATAPTTPAFFASNKAAGVYGMLVGFDPSQPAAVVRVVSADPLNLVVNSSLVALSIASSGAITLSNDLAITEGGTGASTAAQALTNLGAAASTNAVITGTATVGTTITTLGQQAVLGTGAGSTIGSNVIFNNGFKWVASDYGWLIRADNPGVSFNTTGLGTAGAAATYTAAWSASPTGVLTVAQLQGTVATQAAPGDNSAAVASTANLFFATDGVATVPLTGGTVTPPATQSGAQTLIFTGALTSAAIVLLPATGSWTVINRTSGAFSLTLKTVAGTGLLLAQGLSNHVISDGTNLVSAKSDCAGSLYINSVLQAGYLAGALPRTDVYTTVGGYTWTRSALAAMVDVILIGGGGGGGAGASSSNTQSCSGGAGGGAGARVAMTTPATLLAATVTGAVGVAGTAGTAALASASAAGNAGGAGGNATFPPFVAYGGTGGAGGQIGAASTGGIGGGNSGQGGGSAGGGAVGAAPTAIGGGPGGRSGTSAAAGTLALGGDLGGPAGGASGGGLSTTTAFGGGGGGYTSGVAPTAASAVNTAGAAAGAPLTAYSVGQSGSGGGASLSNTAPGAAGASSGYGAGGSGGGSTQVYTTTAQNTGAGAAGTQGLVIVVQR